MAQNKIKNLYTIFIDNLGIDYFAYINTNTIKLDRRQYVVIQQDILKQGFTIREVIRIKELGIIIKLDMPCCDTHNCPHCPKGVA